MDVTSITEPSGTSSLTNGGTVSSTSTQSFDMDDFFQLLAAQLQYQDPSSTTSNDEYMQEMAQFETVEAIQNLVSVEKYSMASGLAGKKVAYIETDVSDTGSYYSSNKYGTVEAVDFSSETPKCYVSSTDSSGKTTSNWVSYSDLTKIYSSDVNLGSSGTSGTSST